MTQLPAVAGRKFVLFALAALVLVWCVIGHDLWLLGRSAKSALQPLGDWGVRADLPPKLLVVVLGLLLTALVWRAGRQLQRAEHEGAARLALQRLVVDHASEAMMVTDNAQRILSINAAFTTITGYRPEDVIGKTPTRLSADHLGLSMHRSIWDFVAQNGCWEGEIWDRRKDGTIYPKQMRIAAICQDGANVSHYVAVFCDISESKAQAQRLEYLARHDPLTNLPNRLALDAHLHAAIEAAVPGMDRMALMIIDLDNFKTVNDSLGHPAGDRLLGELARRMSGQMGHHQRLFRLGGDEFVIFIDRLRSEETVIELSGRLSRVIGEPSDIDGHALHMTPSIGISLYPEDGRDAQTLIRNADTAMYYAKANGRANYKFFTEPMKAAATRRLHLESELWRALADNQLVLHYQPQIDLLSGKVVGVEALVRWRHPTRGLIGPAEFIPVAEECGLILPLGHWVLLTACRQARSWIDQGIDMGEMAVNISAHQFRQPEFAQSVRAILAETGLDAGRLELEITESTIMHGVDAAITTMAELRGMGVRLAIDDFGTGYSSLAYLRRFPLDRLKIDRSFLADIDSDPDAASLLTSIVLLGRSLGLQLVAEGVENLAQAEFLRSLECERVQGFHFYQPASAEEVVGFGGFGLLAALPA
ncbi:EAL domain-containing protein [Dechloromonas sp. XY25]|uniref:EAL domain-containing protein n=1 Tax=Dechloromonas hankyongensis TaxID=2908002 RepID=A0ABS9K0I2_9RHOO|nr:EAL domain-containing protein [Dechloromonas hankyongensis]MCG2576661.1 EAL domain-containing protein [Dechloromonas hankyongensis]